VEGARSMLIESYLSSDYWAEAVSTSAYSRSRSPTVVVNGITPEEAWTGNKPDLSHLRVFGCKALVHVPKQKRSKFDAKAQEYVLVSYCEDSKGYRVVNPATKKLTKTRDVEFLENSFLSGDKKKLLGLR
jgi:hypothetical protein